MHHHGIALEREEGRLISPHPTVLQLPQKILSFIRDGKEAGLERPPSLCEIQRIASMPSEQ